jgi:hypothetical protein
VGNEEPLSKFYVERPGRGMRSLHKMQERIRANTHSRRNQASMGVVAFPRFRSSLRVFLYHLT